MKAFKLIPALAIACALTAAAAHASSFNEVRARVYAEPLTRLPKYDVSIGKAILKALTTFSGELIERGRWTLSRTDDFKLSAPKLIHTYGVCAEGTWRIDGRSLATGILSPGPDGVLELPAIVRFSMATPSPVYKKGSKRNMGIAIKLFASQDRDRVVTTQNVFTLDQTGLTGDTRHSFFFPDRSDEGVYFTNDVPGTGFLSWLGQRTFEKLDPPSTIRALYPLAEIDADGNAVASAVAPRLIRFVPRMKRKRGPIPADFRDEILGYNGRGELAFDIVLPVQYGVARETRIGSLELSNPVLSRSCDLELTFHHAPENRALEKKR